MPNPDHPIGAPVDELDTPALLVDLDRFEANVAHLARYCGDHGTAWRPHSKCHKSPEIAAIERSAGAIGVTCAKLSEAQIMVDHGIDDVLVANQVMSHSKLCRLSRLQERARVIGIVDAEEAVRAASAAGVETGPPIPLLVDVDIGMHRTGVPPEAVLPLARRIAEAPGTRLLGIMGYEGHVLDEHPADVKERACHEALAHLGRAREELLAAGLPCEIVSAGGTGSYALTAAWEGVTEIQAGGGIFMDAMYREKCHVGEELGYALTVLASVTGRHAGHIVLDSGFKTLSAFHYPPRALGRDDLEFRYLSAEHGVFDIREGRDGPALGERIHLLPGYGDSTTVLHDAFLGIRDGRVECRWDILGRGALT